MGQLTIGMTEESEPQKKKGKTLFQDFLPTFPFIPHSELRSQPACCLLEWPDWHPRMVWWALALAFLFWSRSTGRNQQYQLNKRLCSSVGPPILAITPSRLKPTLTFLPSLPPALFTRAEHGALASCAPCNQSASRGGCYGTGLTVLLLVDAGVKYFKLMHGSSEFKVVAIAALALKTVEDSIETFQWIPRLI